MFRNLFKSRKIKSKLPVTIEAASFRIRCTAPPGAVAVPGRCYVVDVVDADGNYKTLTRVKGFKFEVTAGGEGKITIDSLDHDPRKVRILA